MKKLFPKVFEVKVTMSSFIGLFVVALLACAGINSCIKLFGLPNMIETGLMAFCTLYFGVLVLIGFLNLVGIVKIKEEQAPSA